MPRALFLAVISAPLAAACAALWDSGNRTALAADVREVLARGEVDPAVLECHMMETTRSGVCLFDSSETEIQDLTSALGLREWKLADQTEAASGSLAAKARDGCLTSDLFGDRVDLVLHGIGGRPDQLELSNGAQFEYLILLFDPTAGEACVQVSYSYG